MVHFIPMSPEDFNRAQDQQMMQAEAVEHQMMDFLYALDKEQLEALTAMILRAGGELHIATHFTGLIRGIMTSKHGACRCGVEHEQAEDLLKKNSPVAVNEIAPVDLDSAVTDHAFEAHEGSTGAACTAMVTDEEGFGKDCGKSPGKHIFTSGMEPNYETSYTASAIVIMDKYNVSPAPVFPQVKCDSCGLTYTSLRDRMLKGPDDCHGCHMKSAQG